MKGSKFRSKILQHIKKIDMFGAPVTLNIDGRSSYQSAFGGLMTLGMFILVITLFEVHKHPIKPSIEDFFNRTKINVQSTELFSTSPVYLPLNDGNFMFFISIQQPDGYKFIDTPFFSVIFTQTIYQTHQQHIYEQNHSKYTFNTMRSKRFQQKYQRSLQEYLRFCMPLLKLKYGLNQSLCPKPGYLIELEGSFLSQDFKFGRIQIVDCVNQNLTDWNYSCASKDVVQTFLQKEGQFRFQLYSINYVINPDNPKKFTQIYLSEDLNFFFQPNISIKQTNIYFRQFNITTDQSLLVDNDYNHQSLVYRDRTVSEQQTMVDPRIGGNMMDIIQPYFTLYLRSDSLSTKVTRSFQKIDILLSNLGGFIHLFVTLFAVFLKYYNHEYFMLRLANKLYDFKENRENYLKFLPDTRIAQLNNILFRQTKRHASHHLRNSSSMLEFEDDAVDQVKLIGFKDKQELLDTYYEWFLRLHRHFIPGVKYFLYVLSCHKLHNTEHNKLVNQAVHKAEQDMNIRNLMHELSCMKFKIKKISKLLLTEDEKILLDYRPKPRLSLYDMYIKKIQKQQNVQLDLGTTFEDKRTNFRMRSSVREIIKDKQHREYMKFRNLVTSFENVLSQSAQDNHFKRLKILVDKELLTILYSSIQIKQENRAKSPTEHEPVNLLDIGEENSPQSVEGEPAPNKPRKII